MTENTETSVNVETELPEDKLATLAQAAEERYGADTLFEYDLHGELLVLTLSEVLAICGVHIARVRLPIALTMLDSMRVTEETEAVQEKLSRGRELLARRALLQED